MAMKLFGCVCGQVHMKLADGEVGAAPVPFYVLEHPDGVALFDAGMPAAMLDPQESYLPVLRSAGLEVALTPEETVTACLERLDIDPADVKQVVVSHLHFDHIGGLKELPNATLVVQRREWEAGFDKEIAGRFGLRKRYYDFGHQLRLVDGEYDLFGDGTAVCVPSYGHTPGHQSLRVKSEQGDHILVGDACYQCEVVETRAFPEFADHAAMNAALDKLLALREPDTVMVFGHDPAQWGERPVLPTARA